MTDLLPALAQALSARPAIALAAAFAWSVAGILLSPCHLAGVPLVVVYTGRSASLSSRRAAALSVVFALGILVTVALVGVLSVGAGRMLAALGGLTNYLVGTLLAVVGLELLGAWPFRWSGLPRPETTRRGLAGAFLLGLAFGTALGPCTFAFLGPVMGVTIQVGASRPVFAALLMLACAAGHSAVLALAGIAGPHLLGASTRHEGIVRVLRRACGAIVLAGGFYLVYAAP